MPTPRGLHVVRRAPDDPTTPAKGRIVLVHGSMDRASSFTRLMAKLPEWEVIAYDRRGYARSAALGPAESFGRQVDDLIAVLDGRPATAFGHSFGGDVVLAVAQRHPELIPSAFVWEPPQPWLDWWPSTTASAGAGVDLDPEERAEWFMRRMVGDLVWERLPARTRQQRRSEGHTLKAEMDSLLRAALFDPESITIPVLVGRGEKSLIHQRRGARELAASLPGGELVEIPGATHGAHLSHPGQVAQLIERSAEAVDEGSR